MGVSKTVIVSVKKTVQDHFLCPTFVDIFTSRFATGNKTFKGFRYCGVCATITISNGPWATVDRRWKVQESRSFTTIANIRAFTIKTIRVWRTNFSVIVCGIVQIRTNYTFVNVQADQCIRSMAISQVCRSMRIPLTEPFWDLWQS